MPATIFRPECHARTGLTWIQGEKSSNRVIVPSFITHMVHIAPVFDGKADIIPSDRPLSQHIIKLEKNQK